MAFEGTGAVLVADCQTAPSRAAIDPQTGAQVARDMDVFVLPQATGPTPSQDQLSSRAAGLLNMFTGCFSKM